VKPATDGRVVEVRRATKAVHTRGIFIPDKGASHCSLLAKCYLIIPTTLFPIPVSNPFHDPSGESLTKDKKNMRPLGSIRPRVRGNRSTCYETVNKRETKCAVVRGVVVLLNVFSREGRKNRDFQHIKRCALGPRLRPPQRCPVLCRVNCEREPLASLPA
jgi:hypothetical protein